MAFFLSVSEKRGLRKFSFILELELGSYSKNRFITEPVTRGGVFEVSYEFMKLKNDSAGLRPFFTIDHCKTSKIPPLDAGSVINLVFLGLLSVSTHTESSFRKGSANP